MRCATLGPAILAMGLAGLHTRAVGQDNQPPIAAPAVAAPADDALAQDLALLQGTWEMLHGNERRGEPTIRSVKEIKGNVETLRRYDLRTGQLTHEHSAEFTLSQSGSVRVFTFYSVGGDPKQGRSFVYKVNAENFYDVPGLLQGEDYRNYQETPRFWHWKKIDPNQPRPMPPPPPPEIPAELRADLEAAGVRITTTAAGHGLDVRRKPGFTDKQIDLVAQCPQVVDLTLEQVSITDRGLEKLRALPDVKRLILNDCPISSAGLKILAELPLKESLVSIGLRGTLLKDDDLNALKDFPRLERVDVSHTAVTDASLPALAMLPLKALTVTLTRLTDAAIAELQQKHPQLVVKR